MNEHLPHIEWALWPFYPRPLCFHAPARPSGVTIPDHSAQRIAAAQANRERKAARR